MGDLEIDGVLIAEGSSDDDFDAFEGGEIADEYSSLDESAGEEDELGGGHDGGIRGGNFDEDGDYEERARKRLRESEGKLSQEFGSLAGESFKKRARTEGEGEEQQGNGLAGVISGGGSADSLWGEGSQATWAGAAPTPAGPSRVVEKLASQLPPAEVLVEGVLAESRGSQDASLGDGLGFGAGGGDVLGEGARLRSYHSQMADIEADIRRRKNEQRQSAQGTAGFGGDGSAGEVSQVDAALAALGPDFGMDSGGMLGGSTEITEAEIYEELRRREGERADQRVQREAEKARAEERKRKEEEETVRESRGQRIDEDLSMFANIPGLTIEQMRAMKKRAVEAEERAARERARPENPRDNRHSSARSGSARASRETSSSRRRDGSSSSSGRSSGGTRPGSARGASSSRASMAPKDVEARRVKMKQYVAASVTKVLGTYYKAKRITTREDFKHLNRKIAHQIMQKEARTGYVKTATTGPKIRKLVDGFFKKRPGVYKQHRRR